MIDRHEQENIKWNASNTNDMRRSVGITYNNLACGNFSVNMVIPKEKTPQIQEQKGNTF